MKLSGGFNICVSCKKAVPQGSLKCLHCGHEFGQAVPAKQSDLVPESTRPAGSLSAALAVFLDLLR